MGDIGEEAALQAFVESNLGTKIVFEVPKSTTLAEFRDTLRRIHYQIFPEHGDLAVSKIMVFIRGDYWNINCQENTRLISGSECLFKAELKEDVQNVEQPTSLVCSMCQRQPESSRMVVGSHNLIHPDVSERLITQTQRKDEESLKTLSEPEPVKNLDTVEDDRMKHLETVEIDRRRNLDTVETERVSNLDTAEGDRRKSLDMVQSDSLLEDQHIKSLEDRVGGSMKNLDTVEGGKNLDGVEDEHMDLDTVEGDRVKNTDMVEEHSKDMETDLEDTHEDEAMKSRENCKRSTCSNMGYAPGSSTCSGDAYVAPLRGKGAVVSDIGPEVATGLAQENGDMAHESEQAKQNDEDVAHENCDVVVLEPSTLKRKIDQEVDDRPTKMPKLDRTVEAVETAPENVVSTQRSENSSRLIVDTDVNKNLEDMCHNIITQHFSSDSSSISKDSSGDEDNEEVNKEHNASDLEEVIDKKEVSKDISLSEHEASEPEEEKEIQNGTGEQQVEKISSDSSSGKSEDEQEENEVNNVPIKKPVETANGYSQLPDNTSQGSKQQFIEKQAIKDAVGSQPKHKPIHSKDNSEATTRDNSVQKTTTFSEETTIGSKEKSIESPTRKAASDCGFNTHDANDDDPLSQYILLSSQLNHGMTETDSKQVSTRDKVSPEEDETDQINVVVGSKHKRKEKRISTPENSTEPFSEEIHTDNLEGSAGNKQKKKKKKSKRDHSSELDTSSGSKQKKQKPTVDNSAEPVSEEINTGSKQKKKQNSTVDNSAEPFSEEINTDNLKATKQKNREPSSQDISTDNFENPAGVKHTKKQSSREPLTHEGSKQKQKVSTPVKKTSKSVDPSKMAGLQAPVPLKVREPPVTFRVRQPIESSASEYSNSSEESGGSSDSNYTQGRKKGSSKNTRSAARKNPRRNSVAAKLQHFVDKPDGIDELINMTLSKRKSAPPEINTQASVDVVYETQDLEPVTKENNVKPIRGGFKDPYELEKPITATRKAGDGDTEKAKKKKSSVHKQSQSRHK